MLIARQAIAGPYFEPDVQRAIHYSFPWFVLSSYLPFLVPLVALLCTLRARPPSSLSTVHWGKFETFKNELSVGEAEFKCYPVEVTRADGGEDQPADYNTGGGSSGYNTGGGSSGYNTGGGGGGDSTGGEMYARQMPAAPARVAPPEPDLMRGGWEEGVTDVDSYQGSASSYGGGFTEVDVDAPPPQRGERAQGRSEETDGLSFI